MTSLRIAYFPELVGDGGLLSPCSSIRTDYYLKILAQASADTIQHVYNIQLFDPNHFDVVFINRLALASVDDVRRLLAAVRSGGKVIPLILDLDDDLLAIPTNHVDYQRIRPRLEGLALLVEHADAVIVSTPELARALPRADAGIHVVPNRVLLSRIRALPVEAFSGSTRVLYFGTSSHIHELQTLQPLFDPSSSLYTGLELVVAGIVSESNNWYASINVLHPCVDTFLNRLAELRGFRCGLAPLRLGDPLNASKSEIKIFDYAYLGLPVIASACPQYDRVIEHGQTGFLVSDDLTEWGQCLNILESDVQCAEISARAASHLSDIAPSDKVIVASIKHIIQSSLRRIRLGSHVHGS